MPRSVAAVSLIFIAAMALARPAYAARETLDARVKAALVSFEARIPGATDLLHKSAGVLVFPQVYKAGVVFGGGYGDGALLVGGRTVQYYRTTSASFGFQLGMQWRTEIVVFLTSDSLARFRDGNGVQLGIDGSIAVFTLGAGSSFDTDSIREPIAGFIFDDKGLMYDLSFKGNKYWKID